MRRVIGLTGGIGSGKSTAAAILQQLGCTLIDTDAIGHDVMKPGGAAYDAVVSEFGCVDENGEIDRKKLGAAVFADADKLRRLSELTHPVIIDEIRRRIEQAQGVVVLESAVLAESGLTRFTDESWLVTADSDIRARRVMQRSNMTYEAAAERIAAQPDDAKRRDSADRVIENNADIETLARSVRGAFEAMKREADL